MLPRAILTTKHSKIHSICVYDVAEYHVIGDRMMGDYVLALLPTRMSAQIWKSPIRLFIHQQVVMQQVAWSEIEMRVWSCPRGERPKAQQAYPSSKQAQVHARKIPGIWGSRCNSYIDNSYPERCHTVVMDKRPFLGVKATLLE